MILQARTGICIFLALFAFAWPASGDFESMVQVAQPMAKWSGEGTVLICTVQYFGYFESRDRGQVVGMTVAPNLVWTDKHAQNRNLADLAGIRFVREMELNKDNVWVTVLRGDTLRIKVELPSKDHSRDYSVEGVLQPTLWCGLLNARQLWPDVHFVEYVFENAVNEADYGGVYKLDALESSAELRWSRSQNAALESRRYLKKNDDGD